MAGTKRTRASAKAAQAAAVSEEYISDDGFVASDDDAPVSKKTKTTKAATKPAAKKEGDEVFHELSTGRQPRRVNVSEFKGKKLVNIREYYEKDGKMLPGKKGISLTTEQFAELLKALPDIKKALGYADDDAEETCDSTKAAKPSPKLTKKKKAKVVQQRAHPDTFCIEYQDQLYFIGSWLRDEFDEWENGVGDFLDTHDDEEECVEFDSELDGDREDYEPIDSWD